MQTPTPNLGLELTSGSSGSSVLFYDWRVIQNGTDVSNATRIDTWAGQVNGSIVNLQNDVSASGVVRGNSHNHTEGGGAAIPETGLILSDVSTANATALKHGFLQKLSGTAGQFMDGSGSWDTVKDTDLVTSDNTTNNVSASKHGFVPKLTSVANSYFNASGSYSSIAAQIYLSAAGMTPTSASGCASLDTYTTANYQDFKTLDFDKASPERCQTVGFRLPSDYSASGSITASIDWTSSVASGNVIWQVDAISYGDTGALNIAWGTAQSVTDSSSGSYCLQKSANTSAIVIGGTPAAGNLAVIRITRDASNGSDTLDGDAKLIGVTINYVRG